MDNPSHKPSRAQLTGYAYDLAQCLKMWGLTRAEARTVCRELLDVARDLRQPWTPAVNYAETRDMMTTLEKGGNITVAKDGKINKAN